MSSKIVQIENYTGFIEFELSKSIRDHRVITTFTFTNPNRFHILYKLKSTQKNRYAVRPSFGQGEPGSTVKISIVLFVSPNEDLSSLSKDKFNLMVMPCDSLTSKVSEYWESHKANAENNKLMVKIIDTQGNTVRNTVGHSLLSLSSQNSQNNQSSQQNEIKIIEEVKDEDSLQDSVNLAENTQLQSSNQRKEFHEKLEEKDKNIYLLQEEKSKLEAEIGKLRGQIMTKQNNTTSTVKPSTTSGFQLWQVLAVVLISLFLGQFLSRR